MKEVVQLYVSNRTVTVGRPVRELKGFEKVLLEPEETKTVTFVLDKRPFALYHEELSDWFGPKGAYGIEIWKSSRDIVLETNVHITSTDEVPFVVTMNTVFAELLQHPRTQEIAGQLAVPVDVLQEADSRHESDAIKGEMIMQMLENVPLRAFRSFAGKTDEELLQMIEMLNKK